MAERAGFQKKLVGIMELAVEKENRLSVEEVERFFEEDNLSKEQMELVCDYLLSQKVAVTGYRKQPGKIQGKQETDSLNKEEEEFLEDYLREISEMETKTKEDAGMAYYLPLVVKEALKMHQSEVFLGDMIQEGNVSLITALSRCEGGEVNEEEILEEVRCGMQTLLESQTEVKRQDRKMVSQVAQLDETIKSMTEELGRKVAVDEVAEQLGMTEEQIQDILKLAGEEVKDETNES